MTTQYSTTRERMKGGTKSTAKKLMGASLLVLTLAACAGDESATNEGGGGWWGWADPDAWYEGEGGEARRDSSNVEGRPVPPSRLPRDDTYASAEAGLRADSANAAYDDTDVRGSRSGTVESGGRPNMPSDSDLTPARPTEPVATTSLDDNGGRPLTGSGGSTNLLGNYDQRTAGETDALMSAADRMAQDFPSPKFENDLNNSGSGRSMQPNLMAGISAPQMSNMPAPSGVSARGPSGSFDDSFETLTGRNIDTLPSRATRPAQPVVPQGMVSEIDKELRVPNMQYSDLRFERAPQYAPQQMMQPQYAPQPMMQPQPTYRPAPQPQMQQQAYAAPAASAPQPNLFAAATQEIPFLPGSVALSRNDRKKILAAAIKHKNEGGHIVVVGYSANPSTDRHGAISGHKLAMERANKVALALINAGVNPASLAVEARSDRNMRKADIYVN